MAEEKQRWRDLPQGHQQLLPRRSPVVGEGPVGGRASPWPLHLIPGTRGSFRPLGKGPQGQSAKRGLRESVLTPFSPPRRNLGGGQARSKSPLELNPLPRG